MSLHLPLIVWWGLSYQTLGYINNKCGKEVLVSFSLHLEFLPFLILKCDGYAPFLWLLIKFVGHIETQLVFFNCIIHINIAIVVSL